MAKKSEKDVVGKATEVTVKATEKLRKELKAKQIKA